METVEKNKKEYVGCFCCKHYQSREMDFYDEVEKKPQACLLGHNDRMKKWWADNGSKKDWSTHDRLECREDTDGVKMLTSMIDDAKEIKKLLQKHNSSPTTTQTK